MGRPRHSSVQVRRVLAVFAADRSRWRYGYELAREAQVTAGTLYPALARLADDGLLEHHWEFSPDGRRPRHCYRLTDSGVRFAATVRERPSLPRANVRFA